MAYISIDEDIPDETLTEESGWVGLDDTYKSIDQPSALENLSEQSSYVPLETVESDMQPVEHFAGKAAGTVAEGLNVVNRGLGTAAISIGEQRSPKDVWGELEGTGMGEAVARGIEGVTGGPISPGKRAALQTAGDIFLDPTTYLGIGAAAKGFSKAGRVKRLVDAAVDFDKSKKVMGALEKAGVAAKSDVFGRSIVNKSLRDEKTIKKIRQAFADEGITFDRKSILGDVQKAERDMETISKLGGEEALKKTQVYKEGGKFIIPETVKGAQRRVAEAAIKQVERGVTPETEGILVRVGGQKIPFTSTLIPEALVRNKRIEQGFKSLAQTIRKSPIGKGFTTRVGRSATELKVMDRAKERGAEFSSWLEDSAKQAEDLSRGMSEAEIKKATDLFENKEIDTFVPKTATEKQIKVLGDFFAERSKIASRELILFADREFPEQAKNYVDHIMTDAAKELNVSKKLGRKNISVAVHGEKQGFDVTRKIVKENGDWLSLREIEDIQNDKTIGGVSDEITEWIRAHGKTPIFEYNPKVIFEGMARKEAKAISSADFRRQVIDNFGTEAKRAPKDYVNIKGDKIGGIDPYQGIKFSPDIAREIERISGMYTKDEEINWALRNIVDPLNKYWKGYQLISPSYHIRNVISNIANSAMASPMALSLKNYAKSIALQANMAVAAGDSYRSKILSILSKDYKDIDIATDKAQALKKIGKMKFGSYNGLQIMDMLKKSSVLRDEFFIKEAGDDLLKLNPTDPKSLAQALKTIEKKVRNGNLQIGRMMEDQAKINLFTTMLNEGKGIPEAVQDVKKYLFDYGDFTDFENKYLGRIIPFYRWWAKNIPLSIENVFTRPAYGHIVTQGKDFVEESFGSDYDKSLMPEWMKYNVPIDITYIPHFGSSDEKNPTIVPLVDYIPMLQTIGFAIEMTDPNYNTLSNLSNIFWTISHPPGKALVSGFINDILGVTKTADLRRSPYKVRGEVGKGLYSFLPKGIARFLQTAAPRPVNEINKLITLPDNEARFNEALKFLTSASIQPQDASQQEISMLRQNQAKIREIKSKIKYYSQQGDAPNSMAMFREFWKTVGREADEDKVKAYGDNVRLMAERNK